MKAINHDTEKAIVIAFLRTGHPWLAFWTVLIKSGLRATNVLMLALAGAALGPGGGGAIVIKMLSAQF